MKMIQLFLMETIWSLILALKCYNYVRNITSGLRVYAPTQIDLFSHLIILTFSSHEETMAGNLIEIQKVEIKLEISNIDKRRFSYFFEGTGGELVDKWRRMNGA